jgi:hypothetical protein
MLHKEGFSGLGFKTRCPFFALKRPTVAPTESLLTDAVLKHRCVVRTAAVDPKETSWKQG